MGNSSIKVKQENLSVKDIIITDNSIIDTNQLDSIVGSVVKQYIERSEIGKMKYGTTMDRDDLSMKEWIQHMQEELMDATLYLEKIKKINKS